jgi:hypothetical protein
MDAHSRDGRLGGRRRDVRRYAGRTFGVAGCLLAAVGVTTAFSFGAVSVVSGVIGAALGVAGYFLGSRGWGGAAVVLCVAALFVGLAASQDLF